MSIEVLLADDHPIVRQGLHRLLEIEEDFQVVGEANDGLEALSLADQLQPDVLIVDLMMPGLNGLEVTRQVMQRHPTMSVIILSMHRDEAYVLQALRNGAQGYLLKDSSPKELAYAIRKVVEGERYLSEEINMAVVNEMLDRLSVREKGRVGKAPAAEKGLQGRDQGSGILSAEMDPYELLSSRERAVLQLIAEGNTNIEVARRLSISPRTAEAHRASIMHKLNFTNHMELIRFAIRRGVLRIDP